MRLRFLVVVVVVAVTSAVLPSAVQAEENTYTYTESQSSQDDSSSWSSEGAVGVSGDEEVIFSSAPEYGGYLAPTVQVGQINEKAGVFLGGRAGIVVSEVLTVGGGVTWLLEGPTANVPAGPPVQMVYGGGLLGITLASDAIVHPSIEVLLGGGELRTESGHATARTSGDNFFVVDASGGFDINLSWGVRVHLGAGYRHISEVEVPGVTASELGGFFGTAQLKFGVF